MMDALNDERLLWFINRGTGVVLLVLMTASVVLGILATVRVSANWWPRFVTQALHRNLALLSLALLIAHTAASVIDGFVDITVLDAVIPFGSGYEPLWIALGTISLDLTVIVVVTSLVRHRFGLRRWRVVHYTTYLAWLLGLVHGIAIGTDQGTPWSIALTTVCIGAVVVAVVIRLVGLVHERKYDLTEQTYEPV